MNDDPPSASKPDDDSDRETYTSPVAELHDVEPAQGSQSSPPPSADVQLNGNAGDRKNGDLSIDKSDSEAETVVLSGKEEGKDNKMSKAIKLEEPNGSEAIVDDHMEDSTNTTQDHREGSKDLSNGKPSLKRKRSIQELGVGDIPDGGNSSNLSSTISSPVQAAHSSKATDSGSDRSRSSPPFEELAQHEEGSVNKQRIGNSNGRSYQEKGKSDRGAEGVNGRNRRDTRSATHYDEATHRSESPAAHHDRRAQSTQRDLSHNRVTKRRKTPAPLHVDRRRKASEDTHPESDDSSSVHSHHHLHKLASAEHYALSPAKMVNHKKNRDKNGRTWLARACTQGVAEAERWLKERPQDIDVPDNAGNTPLQIASLEGDTEIVDLLLKAGCDVTCKNIDKDTPLIDAVENGHYEVVKMLLKAGLDPRIGNANGSKPLELVPEDCEDAEEIRAVLVASEKEKELLRRPSEDHNRQSSAGSRDVEMTPVGATAASPLNGGRSPPPPGPGIRRRTARSQPTDDALLWVNATPERLRDASGKGDLTIVDHILKMRPKADTESVLAAARGGHDVVLGLLLAIGNVDPDPEPLRSGEYKPAYSTPMLAAIGRGSINVIKLLLGQPGFDPTRRLFRGLTYYEIAKERQGSEWEEEYEMLKEAHDDYKQPGGRKSNSSSPRKVRTKRADSTKGSEPSSTPHEARKARKMPTSKEGSPDTTRRDSHKATTLKHSKTNRRQGSSRDTSDHENEPFGPPRLKAKDPGLFASKRADSLKPKRRLLSGNEFKSDKDSKRRASFATEPSNLTRRKSGDSISRHESHQRRSSDVSDALPRVKSEEPSHSKSDAGKKRLRMSLSPQASKSDPATTAEIAKRIKRQRVDSQGNAAEEDPDRAVQIPPAMVANMIASTPTEASPTLSQGTAPVAFMGSNIGSPVTKSPTELNLYSNQISPVNSIEQTLQQGTESDDVQAQRHFEDTLLLQQQISEQENQLQATREVKERIAEIRTEQLERAKAEREMKAQAVREEAEREARIAREAEEARTETHRRAEEAERQLQLEREQAEELMVKKQREEEMQKRRLEQERLRREDQERKRREQEERESLRRIRAQEEQERLRRQSLPNGLRRAAELSPDEARTAKEITKWLPLRTVTTQELRPDCISQVVDEMWIPNIQAAPILAIKDLELSQCKKTVMAFHSMCEYANRL